MSKFAVRGHIKRTIRDHSLYDVNDYLPSEDILRCKSNTNRPSFPDMPIASELKQINNDAYEKECNQLRQQLLIAKQEQETDRKQLNSLKLTLQMKDQKISSLQLRNEEIADTISKYKLENDKQYNRRQAILSLCSYNTFLQFPPRHRQSYEISIQTDQLSKSDTAPSTKEITKMIEAIRSTTVPAFRLQPVQRKPTQLSKPKLPTLWQNVNKQHNKQLLNTNDCRSRPQQVDVDHIEEHQLEHILACYLQ